MDPIAGKTADPACGWCHGRGWSIVEAMTVTDWPRVERCDECAIFVDDDHACRNAARWVARTDDTIRLREREATVLNDARLAAEESAREARCEASVLRSIIRLAIEGLTGADDVDGKAIRAARRGDT